jgi:cysteine desulfurase
LECGLENDLIAARLKRLAANPPHHLMLSDCDIIYLDNNATTKVAPEVIEAMLPWLSERWGNASAAYAFGRQAAAAIQQARLQVAALLNCDADEIVFTSCATESNNTAFHSARETTGKNHFVVTTVEHSATLTYATWLEQKGCRVTRVPVNPDGTLDPQEVATAITDDTALVSVMWANNETGVILPAPEIANICAEKNVLFHTDAVQMAGKVPMDLKGVPLNFLSLSLHKNYAPRGVGVLLVRRHTRFSPLIRGGSQERGRRAGTENVAAIVAAGAACELARKRLDDEQGRIRALRDRLENFILKHIPRTSVNGHREQRLPNTTNICFDGVDAASLVVLLNQKRICVSGGSACHTGAIEPSHVLTAMGKTRAQAHSSIRISLGFYNTERDIETMERELPAIIEKLRSANPLAMEVV